MRSTSFLIGFVVLSVLSVSVPALAVAADTPAAAPAAAASAPSPDPYANETPAERDARMKWWHEARFGMFIHWGVYSVPAGTYHGEQVKGIGEWIMNRGKIPTKEYQAFAKQFNPVKFNADEWVKIAKDAGMKYMVITSKHHDGFAMFHSKASKWNIVDASPFGRDPLKELSAACEKQGIKLGFYYSQAQDWNNPGGAAAGGHWDKAQDGDMDAYIRDVAAPQVREILTGYGKIAVLWWDTPVNMNKERAEMLLPLLKLQPGIIHNNRLGGGYRGDTETPEQFIPATGYPGRDWETCMTLNDTWGYKSYDHNWKPTETLIRNLVDIASKGGNYLLNVGPTSEGLIPGPSVERLAEVGKWMKVNGESIYATTASPFKRLTWGRVTKKTHGDGTTLYLHVFDWPGDGKLKLPGLKNEAAGAHLLCDAEKKPLATEKAGDDLIVSLPPTAPDKIASVVVLEIKGTPDVVPQLLTQGPDGAIDLTTDEAILHGKKIKVEGGRGGGHFGFWTDPADYVEWKFVVTHPGTFQVKANYASLAASELVIESGGKKLEGKLTPTGDYKKFKNANLGRIELPAGTVTLTVKPPQSGWRPVNLHQLLLQPGK